MNVVKELGIQHTDINENIQNNKVSWSNRRASGRNPLDCSAILHEISSNAPVAQRSERSPYKRYIGVRVPAGVPLLPRRRTGKVTML